jgi:hypothetical protein
MTKKWIAITLLLLVITCLLGWRLRASVHRFNAENDLAKLQPIQDVKQKMVPENPLPKLAPLKKYNPSEFAVIPETNVFSESRTKEEKVEIAAPPEPPPLAQKPILVGVTIADNVKKASIIDPTSPQQDKNRRAQIKRIGDSYHGYTITDITLNHIVLESGTRKEIIPLHEGSKRTQGGKTSILSTRVVSFGGGSSGGTPVSVASGTAVRTNVTPVSSPAPAAQSIAISPAPAQQRATSTSANPAAARPAQQKIPPSGTDEQGRRVIRTPFGTIVRPDRD